MIEPVPDRSLLVWGLWVLVAFLVLYRWSGAARRREGLGLLVLTACLATAVTAWAAFTRLGH
jgi:hypothetical protein